MKLFSPAKINLFLRVVSKRPDGYHNLFSLFQTISLADQLTIELSEKEELICTDKYLPTDGSNLVLKATTLFRQKTGFSQKFKIHLNKFIPSQAGLGGGSSNAATTLWACNQLTGHSVDLATLQQWSAEIGSDIPFFFSQGTAYCTGRGEQVHPLEPLSPPKHLWIVKPPLGLSTPAVYHHLKIKEQNRDPVSYFNDLEEPAFVIQPELKQLKQNLLKQGFETVLLSGSGSAFFCIGDKKPIELASYFPALQCFPVQFLNRSSSDWYAINY